MQYESLPIREIVRSLLDESRQQFDVVVPREMPGAVDPLTGRPQVDGRRPLIFPRAGNRDRFIIVRPTASSEGPGGP